MAPVITPAKSSASGSVIALPQLSYLELITFMVGNRPIGDYWQRVSGGQVQVTNTRSAPPNMRTTIPMAGKYTVAGLTLEREYIPDTNTVNILKAILDHLKDPGNRANDIKIIRELNNTPTANASTRTKVTYVGCVPTSIPLLEDGDTTADANIMPTRITFDVADVEIEIGGTKIDLMQQIGGGFGGSGSFATRGLAALEFANIRK